MDMAMGISGLWVVVEHVCRILGISTSAGRIIRIIDQIKYKKYFVMLPNFDILTITVHYGVELLVFKCVQKGKSLDAITCCSEPLKTSRRSDN